MGLRRAMFMAAILARFSKGLLAWAGQASGEGMGGGQSLHGSKLSERNIRVVDGRPAAVLRFRAVVLAVVRALAQALDPLAGERDAIERLAILLPLRLAHRAGGEDEIALDDVALDVAARALAEDGDFVPAGALDPFAAVVATAEARSDATRSVEPTCLISPTRPMIVNSAIVFMVSVPSFSLPGPSAHAVGPSGAADRKPGETAPAPARNERAGASSGGRRRAAILPREEFGHEAEGENRRA